MPRAFRVVQDACDEKARQHKKQVNPGPARAGHQDRRATEPYVPGIQSEMICDDQQRRHAANSVEDADMGPGRCPVRPIGIADPPVHDSCLRYRFAEERWCVMAGTHWRPAFRKLDGSL